MKLLECEAKTLLAKMGLQVPKGSVVTTAAEAAQVAKDLGCPVAVKAQIPMGGRMKSGGIQFAGNPEAAISAASLLLETTIRGYPVDRVLVEEKIEIQSEVFLGVTYDSISRRAILLASSTGGIDVETGGQMVRRTFSMQQPAPEYLGREIANELGLEGDLLLRLGNLISRMARCFAEWDALLLELNPVVLNADGQWIVADVHLELDDDSLFRQSELLKELPLSSEVAERRSAFERQAAKIDQADHRGVAGRVIPFEGNLGLLIGGGGASLTTMDALLDAGLKPANYCEIGGNPSVWKTKELTKLILSQPRVERLAVIMNVVSNTRVDLVARGVVKGVLELGRSPRDVIAAFRIPGSWEEEGQSILRHYGVPCFGRGTSIDEVVEAIRCQS